MHDEITAVLQAHTLALSAIFASHPEPQRLRETFETMTAATQSLDPLYRLAIDTLRKALPAK
jgi:hypothetical protein